MRMTTWSFSQEELTGTSGVVVTHHPLATRASLLILQEGGNAVDAAVAAAFVMSVVEPFASGIGGGGYMMIYDPVERRGVAVDGSMRAPMNATPEMYIAKGAAGVTVNSKPGSRDQYTALGVAVPGAVAGLVTALERYGTMPLARVMQPAIRAARDGFVFNWYLALEVYNRRGELDPNTERLFTSSSGKVLRAPLLENEGSTFFQPDLADTLTQISEGGADAFYRGGFAQQACDYIQAAGGIITMDDFSHYRAKVLEPVGIEYGNVEVLSMPGVSGGTTVLQALSFLEHTGIGDMQPGSVESLHAYFEAVRMAFADRYLYAGDPDFVGTPESDLLEPGYVATRFEGYSGAHARRDVTATIQLGDPARDRRGAARRVAEVAGTPPSSSETTHISIVDSKGQMVSYTQTSSDFVVPGTGVMMNWGMSWFDVEPGFPNSVAPGKRLLCNMAPLLLLREGRPLAVLGAPGARRIQSALVQVVSNLVDHAMSIGDAISVPRVDGCRVDEMLIDQRVGTSVLAGLRDKGHAVIVKEEGMGYMNFSRPNGIVVSDARVATGGAYPFFHGVIGAV